MLDADVLDLKAAFKATLAEEQPERAPAIEWPGRGPPAREEPAGLRIARFRSPRSARRTRGAPKSAC